MTHPLKILFLGYDASKTNLIDWLRSHGSADGQPVDLTCTFDKVTSEDIALHDWIISFGFRHLLSAEQINAAKNPMLNLHISYLPFNRGAHPVLWAFLDGTPLGVSVHAIDPGIDTGPLYARELTHLAALNLSSDSFTECHEIMIRQVENLFKRIWPEIRDGKLLPTTQRHRGTYHGTRDLPEINGGWTCKIADTVRNLRGRMLRDMAMASATVTETLQGPVPTGAL
jgi:methionyl-tRNA formyltransferase